MHCGGVYILDFNTATRKNKVLPHTTWRKHHNYVIEWMKSNSYTLVLVVWVHLYKVYEQTNLTYSVRGQDSGFLCWEHEESFEIF